jgi:hypothetical protein
LAKQHGDIVIYALHIINEYLADSITGQLKVHAAACQAWRPHKIVSSAVATGACSLGMRLITYSRLH